MKINAIKANGVEYDIWATESDVQALNNQGNAAIGAELQSGKQLIAQAINNVGGEASPDESLSELAQDIEQMPIVNVGCFKFSSAPNLVDIITKQTINTASTKWADQDFREKLIEINDTEGTVTSIPSYCFNDFPNLKKVNLSACTSIGQSCFSNCQSLEYANLPVCTSIGATAFYNGTLIFCKKLYIPKATVIGNQALASPSLANSALEELYLDSMTTHSSNIFVYQTNNYYRFISLKLLSLKQDFDSDINTCGGHWTAATYLTSSADQWENRLLLYQNLLTYTIRKLYDHSQDGVTRTMRLGFYTTLLADSQLTTEPYGSELTPLIKAAAQACFTEADNRGWTLSA